MKVIFGFVKILSAIAVGLLLYCALSLQGLNSEGHLDAEELTKIRATSVLTTIFLPSNSTSTPGVSPSQNPTPPAKNCLLANGSSATHLASMISSGCTIITTDTNAHVTITTNGTMTIPANVQLVFNAGAKWTIATSSTVVVQGTYQIPLRRVQVFDGGGSITSVDNYDTLGCPVTQRVAYPEWFGGKVNDGIDDSTAISQALSLGNSVNLTAGTYDISNRILLNKNQELAGARNGATVLREVANPNILQWDAAGDFRQIGLGDFMIGMASDCTKARDLTLDGSLVPNNYMRTKSNFSVHGLYPPTFYGIAISIGTNWTSYYAQKPTPVKNTTIRNVSIHNFVDGGITIYSLRGADGVIIDHANITARTINAGTSAALRTSVITPDVGPVRNLTITNSSLDGGWVTVYLAGTENVLIENSTITAEPGAAEAVNLYVSDVGHAMSTVIRNSTISMPIPHSNTDNSFPPSVVYLGGRSRQFSIQKAFLHPVPATLSIENSTISSAPYGTNSEIVPLIREDVGLSAPIKLSGVTFKGGNYAILAGSETSLDGFGGDVIDTTRKPIVFREYTPAEIAVHQASHSNFDISGSIFSGQAMSAIRLVFGALKITNSQFTGTGASPAARTSPIIDLRSNSPYDTSPLAHNVFDNNSYSPLYANAFLRTTSLLYSLRTVFGVNAGMTHAGGTPISKIAPVEFIDGSVLSNRLMRRER